MSLFDDIVASFSSTDNLPSMGDLNAYGGITSAIGNAFGTGATLLRGKEAQASAEFEAAQLRQNAGQAQASAQRTAFDEQRRTDMVASRALAVAAASGGGASDPTIINLIAGIAQEGAYRKAVDLYQGDDRARALQLSASAKDFEGKSAKTGSLLSAGASVVSGAVNLMSSKAKGASLYQRFAGGGPGK